MRLPKVSVIILNYNGINFIDQCLNSVINTNYPNFEIVLVDNASSDGSVKLINDISCREPKLILIKNDRNYGFALGNNIGARHATGKYLVFLNIDTIVDPDWLKQLVSTMRNYPQVAAAQSKLLLMDDKKQIDSAGHYIDWFGITFVRGHKEEDIGQYEKIEQIFGGTGAALIIRRDVFEKLGGYDGDFFMLFEESDLCWRIWITGYKVLYIPKAIVFHKSGALRSKERNYVNLYFSRRNRIISMLKNYSKKNLLRFIPISISLLFAMTFFTKNKMEYLGAFNQSLVWIIRNTRKIMIKRGIVQARRRVSDEQLIATGIIRRPCIGDILNKGY